METLPVTLIVKAPNQQIEDQQIKCEPSWTINKLKQHLSEVYPSKPAKHEQKLIYSGQLLSDSVVLKDVLRQYDGQDTHTVHLVCTPKTTMPPKSQNQPQQQQQQQQPSQQERQEINLNETNPSAATSTTTTTDRQNVPNYLQQWYNYNVENSEQYARHLAMQQAYFQFLTHYMANVNYTQNVHRDEINEVQTAPQQPQQQPQQEQQQQQQQAPQVQQQQIQQRDDQQQNRDWLDVFYMFSRVMVFISIVYFYSSPLRFFCVLVFAFGLYLYQIGLLRNNQINNNNILQGGDGQDEQAPSRLMVVWNFFTTFFASLIPEVPNVV